MISSRKSSFLVLLNPPSFVFSYPVRILFLHGRECFLSFSTLVRNLFFNRRR
jgi:hypothetical protein